MEVTQVVYEFLHHVVCQETLTFREYILFILSFDKGSHSFAVIQILN